MTAQALPGELLTERLRLRQWLPGDAGALAEIYADPQFLLHMPALDGAGTAAQIARFQRAWDDDGFSVWAVEDRATGAFVGRIGVVRHHDWPLEDGPVEVGWVLAPAARGRGLATEGGRAAVTAAFTYLDDLDRVISITRPANGPSLRVMERLGFTLAGGTTWRGADVVWYAMERSRWPHRQSGRLLAGADGRSEAGDG